LRRYLRALALFEQPPRLEVADNVSEEGVVERLAALLQPHLQQEKGKKVQARQRSRLYSSLNRSY